MSDLSLLSSFNKMTNKSFHQQKNFIKKVLAGKISQCPVCKLPLNIQLTDGKEQSTIQCNKKCTDIELDCS